MAQSKGPQSLDPKRCQEAEEEHVTDGGRNFLVSPISACNVNDEDDDDDEVEEDEEEEDDDDAVCECRA